MLTHLLVRLPSAFALDCKVMPVDTPLHMEFQFHFAFDTLHSQNAEKCYRMRAKLANQFKLIKEDQSILVFCGLSLLYGPRSSVFVWSW